MWEDFSQIAELKAHLKEHSKSFTEERGAIFAFLHGKHIFTAQDILAAFPNIGRASVFRTISLFLEISLIRRLPFWEKGEAYEMVHHGHHHEHMKCEHCHDIISFESDAICSQISETAKKNGFAIKEHSISILGTCAKCLKVSH